MRPAEEGCLGLMRVEDVKTSASGAREHDVATARVSSGPPTGHLAMVYSLREPARMTTSNAGSAFHPGSDKRRAEMASSSTFFGSSGSVSGVSSGLDMGRGGIDVWYTR